jgi:endo-1,4-beta-D-glucanase Y
MSIFRAARLFRQIFSEAAAEAGEASVDYIKAIEIIEEGFLEAISTMKIMPGNAGQQTIIEDIVIPAFLSRVPQTKPGDDWIYVTIDSYYQQAVSEIIEAGNQIMDEACKEAQEQVNG